MKMQVPIKFSPAQIEIIQHRLEIPDAIFEVFEDSEDLPTTTMVAMYDNCRDLETIIAGQFDWDAITRIQQLIIIECVDGSTMLDAMDGAVGDDITRQKFQAYARAYETLVEMLVDISGPGVEITDDDTGGTPFKQDLKNNYPIKIKTYAAFRDQMESCEYGRYEDALNARAENDAEKIKNNNYDCVLVDFIYRHKTIFEVRNDKELRELYYALASGLIGIRGFADHANTLLDKIRDAVIATGVEGETLVKRWPRQDGF